ncbi:MAG TPA: response regulator, partial [Candidatus Acidoferrales bacterium]|nr:response regulator [Candidatus Acidoferrales bacterium]
QAFPAAADAIPNTCLVLAGIHRIKDRTAAMKKTICFVGFPTAEVAALQAATCANNALWECHFVSNADAALAMLSDRPLDVVVANMSMPGKNGAELLHEAGLAHPKTLGFIVGDVTDQALIINCIGGPHQFIRRPYQPADLIRNLHRGLKLDVWLANDDLRELAPRLRRLPSLPATYFNLLKEVESPAATLQSISEIIARDPVVTARLLHMVNSAAFSLAQKVTDPADAVSLLGIETIKSLVLCLQVFGQRDGAREAGLSLEILWEHSLLVAKFARQITFKETADARLAGDAFTAGLLHDVGRIVIASNLPKEYAAVVAAAREKSHSLHEEEVAQFGVNHAKVGAYLLGLWGLPAPIVEATAAHHAPGQTVFASEFSLLAAVHAANVFAHATDGRTDGLPLPELDLAYFKTLKLDDHLDNWRKWCTGEPVPPPPADQVNESRPPAGVPAMEALQTEIRIADHLAPLWKFAVVVISTVAGILAWHYWSK